MGKLVTTRFEYVSYDDASGQLTAMPPTYPTILDTYIADSVVAAAQSYGVLNLGLVTSATSQTINAPPGASLLVCAPSMNTSNIIVKTSGGSYAPLTPAGGTNQPLFWTVMPRQIVSVPGVWNAASSPLIMFAVDPTNASLTATWTAQILWSV